jgi:hypothetical protein
MWGFCVWLGGRILVVIFGVLVPLFWWWSFGEFLEKIGDFDRKIYSAVCVCIRQDEEANGGAK